MIFLFSDEGKLYFEQRTAMGELGTHQPAPNSWQ